jgi:hypothetical protein
MTDLPTYNAMPPLTPHEPKADDPYEFSKVNWQVVLDTKPTPTIPHIASETGPLPRTRAEMVAALATIPQMTIPQMTDRHERQVFTDKAERVVNKVLAFALTVLAVVFVGGLMYKTFVWGY